MIVTSPALLTHHSIETSTLMSGGRGRILAFSAQYANGGTYRELKPLAGDVHAKDIKTRELTNIPFVAPAQAHLGDEERRRKRRTKYLQKEKRIFFCIFYFSDGFFCQTYSEPFGHEDSPSTIQYMLYIMVGIYAIPHLAPHPQVSTPPNLAEQD